MGAGVRYRSKPSEIEAVQWLGNNWADIVLFFDGVDKIRTEKSYRWLDWGGQFNQRMQLLAGVDGAQGWVDVPWGHWVVRNPGDHRDYWPVEPEYFARKYEVLG